MALDDSGPTAPTPDGRGNCPDGWHPRSRLDGTLVCVPDTPPPPPRSTTESSGDTAPVADMEVTSSASPAAAAAVAPAGGYKGSTAAPAKATASSPPKTTTSSPSVVLTAYDADSDPDKVVATMGDKDIVNLSKGSPPPKNAVDLPSYAKDHDDATEDGVRFLGDDEETQTWLEFLEGDTTEVYMEYMVADDEPPPRGRVFRGSSPPPCDEPPFDYSQQGTCTPNSLAFVPDWTGLSVPFLNENNCQYSVPVQSSSSCPDGEALHELVMGYVPLGISGLMDFLGKQTNSVATHALRTYVDQSAEGLPLGSIETAAYATDLPPRSEIKILFKWPFGLVRALRLEDAPPPEGAPEGSRSFEVYADGLFRRIDELGQHLQVYAAKQAQIWGRQQVKIVVAGSSQEINLSAESQLTDILKTSINRLLTSRDFVLARGGNRTAGTQFEIPATVKVAEKMSFAYDENYQIAAVFARERGGEFEELNLGELAETAGLRNPTMLSYLAHLEGILYDVTRSVPISITEFAQKYHYPEVEVTDAIAAEAPLLLEEGCLGDIVGDEISRAANSIMDSLGSLDDLFADRFAKYMCMTEEAALERNRYLKSPEARQEFKNLLKEEASTVLPLSDPLVQKVIQGLENINEAKPTIFAAWEKLFNKMSMCGLFALLGRTVEFIAKNDVCGITPEKALLTAINSALENIEVQDLKRIFDGLPDEIRPLIQDAYFDAIAEFIREMGSTTGLIFPWDFEERQRTQTEDEEMGLLLYAADSFAPGPPGSEAELQTEYSGALATAFLRGYEQATYVAPSGSLGEDLYAAYWDGFVQRSRDIESEVTSINVETGLTEDQAQAVVNNVQVTLNRQNGGASVGRLLSTMASSTITFLIKALVKAIMDTVQENLTFAQIIELFRDVPVIGAILRVVPQLSKCVVNANVTRDGQPISFSQLQQNLFKGGEIDICNLKPAKKPIVLPNMELIMQVKINTLWASFQNAIIEVLKEVLLTILLKTVMGILRKAIETILGFACAATQGSADQFLRGVLPPGLTPDGNMRDFIAGALCPAGSDEDPDVALAELMASLLPQLGTGSALSLLGPQSDCSFIDRVREQVTALELLDLLEGRASFFTLSTVSNIIQLHCDDLAALLPDEAAVANFFQNLGLSIPQSYLDQMRELLGDRAGGIPELDPSDCPSLDEATDNLRELLNCEEAATPEQIDAYIEAFQNRMAQTIEDSVSALAGGLDSNMGETIQNALQDLVPKDEPGNLLIAEDIVSVLFDPLYVFYARDLMNPIGAGGRPNNAGLINMVLANKNGVGITGQISNYGAATAGLGGGPLLTFAAALPPPFNFMASAGALENLSFNLKMTFFGPELDPDAEPLDCSEIGTPAEWREFWEGAGDATMPPATIADPDDPDGPGTIRVSQTRLEDGEESDAFGLTRGEYINLKRRELLECRRLNRASRRSAAGLGPYGHGPLKKPETIARSLQTLLGDMTSYMSIDGEQLTSFCPFSITLDKQIRPARYPDDATIFDLNYNFETGLFQYITYDPLATGLDETGRPYEPYSIPSPEESWVQFETTNNSRLELELAEYLAGLPLADDASINPTTAGAGVLYQNILNNTNPIVEDLFLAAPEPARTRRLTETGFLVRKMSEGVASSFANIISQNHDAFNYGEYNLEALTDLDVLRPDDEILDKGYSFMYLDDGRIFVSPPPQGGWLDVKDRLLPATDETFCCPDKKEIFDVQSIKDRTLEGYKIAEDDPRLALNPKTVHEPPYAKILSRMNLAACEGNIIATIRTYVIEHFLKGYATYNKFPPRSPEVHSDILAEYIADKMRRGLYDQHNQPGAPVWPPGLIPNTEIIPPGADADFPDGVKAQRLHAYWYEFLEQCVQTYSRRIKAGISPVTPEINSAMTALQQAVDEYTIPDRREWRITRERIAGVMALTGFLVPFIPIMLANLTFKKFKRKVKVDVLRTYEPQATVILKQLIKEELNRAADELEDIFEPPTGGRINNIYLAFLNSAFSIGERNVFDVPIDPLAPEEISLQILPSYTEDELRTPELGGRFSEDQFVLEGYVRVTFTEEGRDLATDPLFVGSQLADMAEREDGQIYRLTSVRDSLAVALDLGISSELELGNIFETFQYGLRLVSVVSLTTVAEVGDLHSSPSILDNLGEAESLAANTQGLFTHPPRYYGDESGTLPYGEVSLPLVYTEVAETPFVGTFQDFVNAVDGTSYNVATTGALDWSTLATLMTQTNQFRTLFEYASPLNTILSLVGIYNTEAFLSSIGGDDDWKTGVGLPRPFRRWNKRIFPVLKRKLKKQFNEIYNSNDFTYVDQGPERASREEVERVRARFNIDWPRFGELTFPVSNRLVFSNPMCYADEVGVDPTELFTEVEPEEPPTGDSSGDPPPPAPEPEGVAGGKPETDYGKLDEETIEGELSRDTLGAALAEVADIAGMEMGGFELMESLRSGDWYGGPGGFPAGVDEDLLSNIGIIWGWGLPDGPPLDDFASAAGLTGAEASNLSMAAMMVTVDAAFGHLDYDGIASWGRYHGYGASMGTELADQVMGLLDLAALPENAAAISAATEMLVGLLDDPPSLNMGDAMTGGSV